MLILNKMPGSDPNFKQFVPSRVCLQCDGCCRFRHVPSPWQPRIAKEEITKTSVPLAVRKLFSPAALSEEGVIKTVPYEDMHVCHFFNPQHNTCGIYAHRPFECQLYPFLLMREARHVAVCVHLLCPYVYDNKDSKIFGQYVAYLREFFARDDVRAFLQRNPGLVGDYTPYKEEWEPLFRFMDPHSKKG